MSFFDEVETTVANTRFLQAQEDTGAIVLPLKPRAQLDAVEGETAASGQRTASSDQAQARGALAAAAASAQAVCMLAGTARAVCRCAVAITVALTR